MSRRTLRKHGWLAIWSFTMVALTTGCAKRDASPAKEAAGGSVVSAEELPNGGDMPSEEDAAELAREIEKRVSQGDEGYLRRIVDWNLLLDRALTGIELSEPSRSQLQQVFLTKSRIAENFAGEVVKSTAMGGSYRFLGVRQKNGEVRVLFRADFGVSGLNYHNMLVVEDKTGKLRIGDIYVFLSAEDMSTTLRRALIPVVAQQNRSLLDKLRGVESEYMAHLSEMHAMATNIQAGRSREAMKIHDSLPASLQKQKSVMIIRYRAASDIGVTEVQEAAQDFRKYHPNDPCLDMLSIDLYATSGKTDQAIKCIDRIDEAVGGDPRLNVLRAGCYRLAKRYDEAREAAEKAIEAEPTDDAGHWELATIALESQDYAEVNRLLTMIETQFDLEIGDLTQQPIYAEYVKSPEYQEWLSSHKP